MRFHCLRASSRGPLRARSLRSIVAVTRLHESWRISSARSRTVRDRRTPPPGLERLQTVLLTSRRSVVRAATAGLESWGCAAYRCRCCSAMKPLTRESRSAVPRTALQFSWAGKSLSDFTPPPGLELAETFRAYGLTSFGRSGPATRLLESWLISSTSLTDGSLRSRFHCSHRGLTSFTLAMLTVLFAIERRRRQDSNLGQPR